jgi:protein-S-isoprenylcysteine O-methyltransferase Ste14
MLLSPLILLSFAGFSNRMGSIRFELIWELSCFLISFLGLLVRILTVGTAPRGTSGRSTKCPRAEVLNTTGMYSVVRHPLYLGNYLIILGVSLFPRSWALPIIVSLAFILHHERVIFGEEKFLESKFGDKFRAWAARVPIAIPRFRNYHPPELSFSWKVAFKRESYGLFGIGIVFFALEAFGDLMVYHKIQFHLFWLSLFMLGFVSFVVMQFLKKRTCLLKVRGR